jgi:hypothetical protein
MNQRSATQDSARIARRAWMTSAAAVIAVAGCNDLLLSLPSEGPPQAMSFALAELGTDRRTVEVRGDTVVMRRFKGHDTPELLDSTRTVPSAADWRAFWSATERAGVRKWARRYADYDVVHGIGWGLRITHDNYTLETDGSNAYPDRNGRQHDEVTEDFLGFVRAMGDLAGKPL